jgi:hypothetical protein
MRISFINEIFDTNEWDQLIKNEDDIPKDSINHYDYSEFQKIQYIDSGAFGSVYQAIWESQDTLVALKSFKFNKHECIMKEIVNEVLYKIIKY